MNVLAGIMIGAVNDWLGVLVVPFVWGVTWLIGAWILGRPGYRERPLPPGSVARRIGSTGAYYLTEFLTATTIALPIAIVTRALLQLVGR